MIRQEFKILNPWFITGFSDGDGTFSLVIRISKTYKIGYRVVPVYSVCAKNSTENILLLKSIQNYFSGIGHIYSSGNISRFEVHKLEEHKIIRKHFEQYPLQSTKYIYFKLWCETLDIMNTKNHLIEEGFYKILAIKSVFPKGISTTLKTKFPNILPYTKPQFTSSIISLDPNWIAGFVQADGNFDLSVIKSKNKLGQTCNPQFKISQHSRDLDLLNRIMTYFSIGKILKPNKNNVCVFYIAGLAKIVSIVIPFFKIYSLYGMKLLDFNDFVKGIEIMKIKGHLTEKGLTQLKALTSNMNYGRNL